MNRIKELYILCAISLYPHSDGDYLCENAKGLLESFNIDKKDYFLVIDELEKEGIVDYEEKYYEDDEREFSYDGKKVNHKTLSERISVYKKWCGYKDEIDLRSVKALADEIRKRYREEDLSNALVNLSQGLYTNFHHNLEETLFYYLSAKKEVAYAIDGLTALAQMFDLKYHNAEQLIKLPEGFFDTISTYFGEMLEEKDYQFWYEKLPKYIKEKAIKEKDADLYYITKKGEDFYYKTRVLDLSKSTDYYKVFSVFFNLSTKEGGHVDYSSLEKSVQRQIKKVDKMEAAELRSFIQRNLTDEQNGFLQYAKIENITNGGKKLIKTVRGKGIDFNNKIE
jgi:hypothetical protein